MGMTRVPRCSVFIILIAAAIALTCSWGCNGNGPDDGCLDNTDCEAAEYCKKEEGNCGGTGECLPMEEFCPDLWSPECGCDGVTYSNDCYAAAAGVNIAFEGQCPTLCASADDCLGSEYCDKSTAGCVGEGVCLPIVSPCPAVWDPVCGCDGVTYGNDCEASRADIEVDFAGECPPPPCTDNSDCAAAEYCQKATGDCSGTGGCVSMPEYCFDVWDPVCGCDNNTYGNACEAAVASVNIASAGVCPPP